MMEELVKYLSEKLDVDVSKISATSHLIDDLDSDDWTNLEVIIDFTDPFYLISFSQFDYNPL